jgi:AcrR family transcriptional regulator
VRDAYHLPVARRAGSHLGRPRDASFDERALDATRALLAERGFAATTVQAVAARSGVHASAIYRRWPSRVELIEDAVFPGLDPPSVRPTGDLRRDLRRFVRAYLAALDSPAARSAIPGLMAEYQSAGRSGAPEVWLHVSARPQFGDILRAAPPGTVDPDVDADDVFDVLLGTLLARVLVPTVTTRRRPVERVVDLALRMLAPRAEGSNTTTNAAARRVRRTRREGADVP